MTWFQQLIQRPVAVAMIFLSLVLLGTISLFRLPVDLLPETSYPVLSVTTFLGGYSPLEIEQAITKPIEAALASLQNLVRLRSVSQEGRADIQMEFKLGTDMDFAMQEVRERLAYLLPTFPEDTLKPQVSKYDPNASPILAIGVFGPADEVVLRQAAEDLLQKSLARVPGVAHIEVIGGRRLEIVIEPDLERLKALRLSILDLTNLLKQSNVDVSLGAITQGQLSLPWRSTGEFRSLADIKKIGVLRTPSGSIISLGQVARVSYVGQAEDTISRYQGDPRVIVQVYREYGSHIVAVSRALRHELARLQKRLPFGVKTEINYDQGTFILDAVQRLRLAGLIGAVLAMAVVFLFLRHVASTLAIAAAIPISVLGTFGFMFLSGISLNLVSLAGLTLGIGMLVDNAIVVIENIYRYRHRKLSGLAAACLGTTEVLQALTAATLLHLAVFFPLFFLQKRIRLLYQDLFYTVSFSLLISLAVAVILAPVVAARFPRPTRRVIWLAKLKGWHRRLLLAVLRQAGLWAAFALVLLATSLIFFPFLGFESSTPLDRGEFILVAQTQPGTIQTVTDSLTKRVERLLLALPEVQDVSTRVQDNVATLRVRLVPPGKRQQNTRQVVERLRPQLEALPFSLVHFNVEGTGKRDRQLSLEILGPQQETLIGLALNLRRQLQNVPYIRDVVIHLRNPVPEIVVKVEHQRAANLGLSAADIAHGIRAAITGPLANRFRELDKELDIRTRLPAAVRDDYQLFSTLSIPKLDHSLRQEVLVPIWPAIGMHSHLGPTEMHRLDRVRAIELTAEIHGLDLYRATQSLQPLVAKMPRPPGYEIRFGQNIKELQENRREIGAALLIALLLVSMIMAALFESFRAPLVILSSVPLAVVGVVAVLLATRYAVSLAVYVGALVLLGIVLNNAIVLVDHINTLRAKGLRGLRAVVQGTQDRLRPILITSATAILGLLPMALERQEGSQLWSPLAWTVIGGLLSATLLTLFILPAHYLLIMRPQAGAQSAYHNVSQGVPSGARHFSPSNKE
ncbi:MAG: efflux RND transporter permease subunit [Desulfobacca sp.]|uniref:efflux RND transporter permease subunit n=1 Tax=Desulfobacca sp. TaxID=2067990 RepID=UPI00404B87F8